MKLPCAFLVGSLLGATALADTNISWYSLPSGAVLNQHPYFVGAYGTDSDGNLSSVSVWKESAPFALNGGGDGWQEWSGNTTSDTGDLDVAFHAEARDAAGNTSGVIYTSVHILANHAPTVQWDGVTPNSVDKGTWYTVRANGHDDDGDMTGIHIYKDGQPFAFALYGSPTDANSNNPDYASGDPGSSNVYSAEAHDATGASSGYIYRTISVNNHMPSSSFSPTLINTYINGSYTFTGSASDEDNNLQQMRCYEYAWEDVGGVFTQRQNYQLVDTVGSVGSPISKTYTQTGGKPFKWNYEYVLIARDAAGSENWPAASFNNILWVYLDDRKPQLPTLVSAQSRIQFGQSVVISANGSDPDQNATYQYLWYQGPDDGPNDWHMLTSSSYATGTGNTVLNFTFTPAKLGHYVFKSRVDDPYWPSVEVTVDLQVDDVAPNAPTNLHVTETHSDWMYLAWTISTSNNVAAEHLYWKPTGGTAITDIALGLNVAGVSVTGLTPSTSYDFWLKAANSFGTYSAASNTVTSSTSAPPLAIITQPQNEVALVGGTATFSVVTTGTPAPTYQWRKNGVNITGATSATLTLSSVQQTDAATYSVVATNGANTVTSIDAGLSVVSDLLLKMHRPQ